MRKGIIVTLAGIVLVLAVLFALCSTTGVEIRLDGSVISDTYEETMEYTQGMTYDALEEQLLSRVQFIEDGTDITAEVRVRGSQEGLVSLGTHELEFVRSDDSVLLHLRVVITDTTPPTLQGTASYTAGTGTSFKAENLDLQVYDNYDIYVLDSVQLSEVDTSRPGTQQATVTISDQSGNTASMDIEVVVRDDAEEAPIGTQVFVQEEPDDLTLLLNATHQLPDGWEPTDLESVTHDGEGTHYLRKEAADAWQKLYEAAKEADISINVVSSFRTQSYQENLFNSYLAVDPDAATYSAAPRTSEHELGLTLDISYDHELHEDLQTSALGRWMSENSYRYGWIVRYPQGKEDVTQYIYEPWHYRYVGVTLATYLHANDLTLEEYYAQRSEEASR